MREGGGGGTRKGEEGMSEGRGDMQGKEERGLQEKWRGGVKKGEEGGRGRGEAAL